MDRTGHRYVAGSGPPGSQPPMPPPPLPGRLLSVFQGEPGPRGEPGEKGTWVSGRWHWGTGVGTRPPTGVGHPWVFGGGSDGLGGAPCSILWLGPGTPMMAWGSPAVPSTPHLTPGTPRVVWGGGLQRWPVPHVSSLGPQWWHGGGGGSQLCQDPVNGRGVPSCALTPGTPVMAHGSLAVLVSPPPPKCWRKGVPPLHAAPSHGGGGSHHQHSPSVPGQGDGAQSQPPPRDLPNTGGHRAVLGAQGGLRPPPPPRGRAGGLCPPQGVPPFLPPIL